MIVRHRLFRRLFAVVPTTTMPAAATLMVMYLLTTTMQFLIEDAAGEDYHDTSQLTAEEILLKVFDDAGGYRWTNHDGWLQGDDACMYHGVTCFTSTDIGDNNDERRIGYIRSIDLTDNNLVGTLSSAIFDLPYLESLTVRGNDDLTVNFENVGEGQFLQQVDVSGCYVTNLDYIDSLSSSPLDVLDISNTGLTGSFPMALYRMSNLRYLDASDNWLSGELSGDDLLSMERLESLYLDDNKLQGRIPSSIGRLSLLKVLSLEDNKFTGTIPREIGDCTGLEHLVLGRVSKEDGSGLTGSLPSFFKLEQINQIQIKNQGISGTIPDDFIRDSLDDRPIIIDLTGNELSGPLPASLSDKTRLTLLLADNKIDSLSSDFCSHIGGWMNGDVETMGCEAFLCPVETYAPEGHATTTQGCRSCSTAEYMGATSCGLHVDETGAVDERSILVSFYNAMGGRYWKDSAGWLGTDSDHCGWYGIECNSSGQVTRIQMRNNDLTNTVPDSVFSLSELTELDLSSNSIDLSFTESGTATNLQRLDLTNTNLATLDDVEELAKTNLRRLYLASNHLEGSIPAGLFSIVSLEELDISQNRFSGPIPGSIGQLTELVRFRCFGNELTGQFPMEVGNLLKLVEILAAENGFTGVLPTGLNSLTQLQTLSLHQTTSASGIGGPLLALNNLKELTSLQLDGNALTGRLPVDFLSNTERGSDRIEVLLEDNMLSGSIPSSWGTRFSQLFLDLSGNQISGIDPSICAQSDWMDGHVATLNCDAILCPTGSFNDFGRATSSSEGCQSCSEASYFGAKQCGSTEPAPDDELSILFTFFASTHGDQWVNNDGWMVLDDRCAWTGVFCNANRQVVKISLEDNGLTGTPDSSIFLLPMLQELNLERNAIQFAFEGIGQATSLLVLTLSGTHLESLSGIEAAVSLQHLKLADNDLYGTLPTELFQLVNLRELVLSFNSLEGRLPSGISALKNLEGLYLHHNRFDGELPAALGSLTNLRTLGLSENNFSGRLPVELNDLLLLEVLAIQREGGTQSSSIGVDQGGSDDTGNGLTGPLLSFDKLTRLRQLFLGVNSLSGSIPYNFLDGVADKQAPIEVDLISNQLTGVVPASLSRFEKMTMFLADNEITGIADSICGEVGWMEQKVLDYDCDGFLCQPGTFSIYGRQVDVNSTCQACPSGSSAPYYGSFKCLGQGDQESLEEREILEELYQATGGDYWREHESWLDRDLSVCEWYGIECRSGANASVTAIHLPRNGLSGEIPPSIFNLPDLEEIDFGMNDVKPSFEGIGAATNLQLINLDSTGLSSLSGLEAAPALRLLHLEDNAFSAFPSEIFSLGTLEVLYLSGNSFAGELSDSIGSLQSLVAFSCNKCGLSGPLSSSMGSLTNLEYLRIASNSFTGILPPSLQSLSKLRELDLSDQISDGATGGFSGSMPAFANCSQLAEINLSRNRFEGAIPDSFLQIADPDILAVIDLETNELTGPVPSSLSRFNNLNFFLAENKIDDVPTGLCTLSWNGNVADDSSCDFIMCPPGSFNGVGRKTDALPCESCTVDDAPFYGSTSCGESHERDVLDQLYRELGGHEWTHSLGWGTNEPFCTWYGVTCYGVGSLLEGLVRGLDLGDNNLVGTVPDQIWLLTHIEELNLRGNAIDVSFDLVGDAVSLKTLELSNTRVKSLVGIGASNSLRSLHVTGNGISEPLPEELFDLEKMQRLYLSHNNFTGSLPSSISKMREIKEIYIFDNDLGGHLPDTMGNLIVLEVLSLGENKLTGSIPGIFSHLPFLRVLNLQNEKFVAPTGSIFNAGLPGLTGDLPPFHKNSQLRELYLGSNSLGSTIPGNFLDGILDKTATVRVDISHNRIMGSIPTNLTNFDDLRLIASNNLIVDVPDEICAKTEWMEGLLASGCDAFLCPPGYFNEYGRETSTEECHECDRRGQAQYYGSDYCGPILGLETEHEILSELYAMTDGFSWLENSNWDTDAPVCEWYGISCGTNAEGQSFVEGIELPANNLIGVVPGLVFSLPNLKLLDLSTNAVRMAFREIGAAQSLEQLYLEDTNVVSLEALDEAKNLRALKLSRTFLGTTFPTQILALPLLEELEMEFCGISGPLSSSIGQLTMLEWFNAAHNELTGTLPESLGNLGALRTLVLSANNFYGPLPTTLQSLQSLETIMIHARDRTTAGLSGPLPAFADATHLTTIDLGGNSLTGTVPSNLLIGVADPSAATNVFLDSNLLVGEIPSDLSRFGNLNIDLAGNEITSIGNGLCEKTNWWNGDVGLYQCDAILCAPGTYNDLGRHTSGVGRCEDCEDGGDYFGSITCPSLNKKEARTILEALYDATGGDDWWNKDGWKDPDVDICEWYGVSCKTNSEVESLVLGSNNLVGVLPKEIFQLSGLKFLWLYSNPIDFSFDGIEHALSLQSLQLDSTGLSSLEGIGDAPALKDVDVRFNNLHGSLPSEIGDLVDLETFFCGDNKLTGEITVFARNRKLKQLRVGGNHFSGKLPAFDVHPTLKTLDVSSNGLSGEVPSNLLEATDPKMEILIDISSNQLSGELPASLNRFPHFTLYARDNRIEGISTNLCEQLSWNNGDVGIYGCDGILCPPRTYSSIGRASEDGTVVCIQCDHTHHQYLGSSTCADDDGNGNGATATKSSAGTRTHSNLLVTTAATVVAVVTCWLATTYQFN